MATIFSANLLLDSDRRAAERLVAAHHYSHCVPSGKTYWFGFEAAVVSYSIPANQHADRATLGRKGNVWELTRLWAPDGHRPNLLTQAIATTVKEFAKLEPGCEAIVSYADPNAAHHGGIYQAASWIYLGQSTENRAYVDDAGQTHARRKFHSGDKCLRKAEIEALGYREIRLPGKHRYARGLTKRARAIIAARSVPYLKENLVKTDMAIVPGGLTADEEAELVRCEEAIDRAGRSFVEAGLALRSIRDSRLYRKGHPTFEDYCERRWEFKRAQAYRLIDAAEVVESIRMSPIGDILPGTESQARELTVIRDEGCLIDAPKVSEAWTQTLEAATTRNVRVTASLVREVVSAMGYTEGGDREPAPPLDHLRKWWGKASEEDQQTFLAEVSP